jgi:hypothetical protein
LSTIQAFLAFTALKEAFTIGLSERPKQVLKIYSPTVNLYGYLRMAEVLLRSNLNTYYFFQLL